MKSPGSHRTDTHTDSKTAHHEAAESELAPWNLLSELGRQQLAIVTESASAMYRGSEALHKIQQETAHEAAMRHAQAAQKLFSPCQPADLLTIQSELLCTDMESAGQYWQQLAAATMHTQREMMASMSHLLDSNPSGTGLKSAMEAFQAAIPALAMKNFLTRPDQANAQSSNT